MLAKLAGWFGASAVIEATTWLAWLQISDRVPPWSLYASLGGVGIFLLLGLPLALDEDGTVRRVINARGRSSANVASGDHSKVVSSVVATGKKPTIYMMTPTPAEAERISNDTGRSALASETRPITMPDARAAVDATLNQRFGELTDMLMSRINARDNGLYDRFTDPRFLGPLGSAHRAYAEIGDKSLGERLSSMLEDLAAQTAGDRREIFLRQAIDVTRNLTLEHVNSLAVKVFISTFAFAEPYDTDTLIRSLDNLLSPYYQRIPTSRLDYMYMASAGVCQHGQLGSFSLKPFEFLHQKYSNAMYPGLRYSELSQDILKPDTPQRAELESLLVAYVESEDDMTVTEAGVYLSEENALLRIAVPHATRILSRRNTAEQKLTQAERNLRQFVFARMATVEQFTDRVNELRPELAELLRTLERTDALAFPLQPVGFALAQHAIQDRTPQVAALIEKELDGENS
jgi:hypothetical protein